MLRDTLDRCLLTRKSFSDGWSMKSHPQTTNPRVIENKLNAVHPEECPSNFFFRGTFTIIPREICCGHEHHEIYIVKKERKDDGLEDEKRHIKEYEHIANDHQIAANPLSMHFKSESFCFCDENLWNRDFPS